MTSSGNSPESSPSGEHAAVSYPANARFIAPALAWVFPGLGHGYLGRKGKALVFCFLVLFAFAFGMALDGKLYHPERGNAFALLGSYACIGYGPAYFLLQGQAFAQGDLHSPTNEYGNRFVLTGGLMNLLLMLDAFDIAAGRKKKKAAPSPKEDDNSKAADEEQEARA